MSSSLSACPRSVETLEALERYLGSSGLDASADDAPKKIHEIGTRPTEQDYHVTCCPHRPTALCIASD